MKSRKLQAALTIIAVLSLAVPVFAVDRGEVDVSLTHLKIVKNSDGKEKSESAAAALPGDVVEYRVVYRNKGKGVAREVTAELPIPKEMSYLPGTAKPAEVSASVDGKVFAPVPLKRRVKLAGGKEEIRAVPYGEYRMLRWNLKDMAPGKSVAVTARGKVNQ